MNTQYLFGYGSLINQQSREITGITKNPIPVKVHGFERSWCVPVPSMNLTGLGIAKSPSAECNGILVELDEKQLKAFDLRELGGSNSNYERIEISKEYIEGNLPTLFSNSWAYVVKKPAAPTMIFPIAQTYLDVILEGCLEFGENFASDFIKSTIGWKYHWINDRKFPRYIRHQTITINWSLIDELLRMQIPNHFGKRLTLT